ncbi:hypothetical protein [uncultured Sphingomonas sp.]|uniref:hypothetical protein n=1 Tax=uncultured Sphingomonas sp. TaxID=158754 RepID=UPI003748A8D8
MREYNINEALRAIRSAIQAWTGPTITGGQLAALIRAAAPGLEIRTIVGIPKGPGALTEFIKSHLSDTVERIGSQGSDALLRIVGRDVEPSAQTASPQVWRTFVSPNSDQHLVLSGGGVLLSRETPASADAGETEIGKATVEEHDRIRADFVDTLTEQSVAALGEFAAPDAEFGKWIAAMRERLPGSLREWGHFRRKRLSELFAARIGSLALEKSFERTVLEQVEASEVAAYGKANKAAAAAKRPVKVTDGGDVDADRVATARRLAHAAIDLLSYEDLRRLRIPLGVVLDTIAGEG